jgi:hypothetical protein
VRFHYLRDLVKDEVIMLEYCKTQDQMGDLMTKPLKLDSFCTFKSKLGMMVARKSTGG